MSKIENLNLSKPKSLAFCYWRTTACLQKVACALCLVTLSTVIASAQNTSKPYIEDLSAYRPTFELKKDTSQNATSKNVTDRPSIKPAKNVNAKLDAVLDSIDKQNLQKKFIDGFTIQLYSSQSKEEALNIKQKVIEEFANLTANLQYLQPKFRVNVGGYFSKLEAQKDLVRLKSFFPSAILVPEKIQVR